MFIASSSQLALPDLICAAVVQRFVMQPDMPVETALRVYRRYLKLEPSHTEEYIAYLKSKVNSVRSRANRQGAKRDRDNVQSPGSS